MFRINLSGTDKVREARFIQHSAKQGGKEAVQLLAAKQHTLKGGDPLSIRFRCGEIADILKGEIIPRVDR